MSQLGWMLTSLVLFLVAFPLLSVGTATETVVVWVIGLGLVTLGGVIPPLLRYVSLGEDGEDGEEGNGDNGGSGEPAAA
jgi:hypothetical protein